MNKQVEVIKLKGPLLRYKLAEALGYRFKVIEPTYGVGHRILVEGTSGYFRPDVDWVQLGPLLDLHWRDITAWLVDYYGPNWRDDIDTKPGGLRRWFCIALVGSRLGNAVDVPEVILV